MLEYEKVNLNPKSRITGDCSTRAIAGTLGIPYLEALRSQYEAAAETFYGITDKQTIEIVLYNHGYIRCPKPRKPGGRPYKVGELDELLPPEVRTEGVLVFIGNHYTCVIGDAVTDIWDCRYKTVHNYYVREEFAPPDYYYR